MLFFALILATAPTLNRDIVELGPKIVAPTKRVVTVAPSLSEMVIALGALETLVGVSRFDEDSHLKNLPRVGGFNDLSLEAVLTLKPSVVLVQKAPANQKAVERLAALGVPVVAYSLTHVSDVESTLTHLGKVLGKEQQVEEVISSMRQKRKNAKSLTQKQTRTVFIIGFAPLIVAGPQSFISELAQDLNLVNAVEKSANAYPAYSAERLVRLHPDLIVDATDAPHDNSVLKKLLQKSCYVELPSRDLLHPSPSAVDALQPLHEVISKTCQTSKSL